MIAASLQLEVEQIHNAHRYGQKESVVDDDAQFAHLLAEEAGQEQTQASTPEQPSGPRFFRRNRKLSSITEDEDESRASTFIQVKGPWSKMGEGSQNQLDFSGLQP